MTKTQELADAYAKGRLDEKHRWHKKIWATICYEQLAGDICPHIDCHALVQLTKDLKDEPNTDL